jgi:hypothetical protein
VASIQQVIDAQLWLFHRHHILGNIPLYSIPPISGFEIMVHLIPSWMNGISGFVSLTKYLILQLFDVRHTDSSFVLQYTLIIFHKTRWLLLPDITLNLLDLLIFQFIDVFYIGKIQGGQDCMFLFWGGPVNYKAHYSLSWFSSLLRGNSPTSSSLILKMNNGYNGVSTELEKFTKWRGKWSHTPYLKGRGVL